MKLRLAALSLLVIAMPAVAGPIDGTWKADLKTAKLPTKPDVFSLKNGMYGCSSCKPAYSVKADGAFHPIAGHAYVDMMAIKVVDAHTVEESDQLKGKLVGTSKTVVAPDGKSLTFSWSDMSAPNGQVAHGEGTQVRVGAAPAGEHAMAGSWRTTKLGSVSDQALTGSWMQQGQTVTFKTPDGFGYTATLGGKPVTMIGNPESQTVSVKAIAGGLQETSYDGGKVAAVRTMTVLPGGKTMKVVSMNKKQGTTTTYMMHRL